MEEATIELQELDKEARQGLAGGSKGGPYLTVSHPMGFPMERDDVYIR